MTVTSLDGGIVKNSSPSLQQCTARKHDPTIILLTILSAIGMIGMICIVVAFLLLDLISHEVYYNNIPSIRVMPVFSESDLNDTELKGRRLVNCVPYCPPRYGNGGGGECSGTIRICTEVNQ